MKSKVQYIFKKRLNAKLITFQIFLFGHAHIFLWRCGVLYMDPQCLHWTLIVKTWLKTFPKFIPEGIRDKLTSLFDRFCIPLLKVIINARVEITFFNVIRRITFFKEFIFPIITIRIITLFSNNLCFPLKHASENCFYLSRQLYI
jgi:hypothetical protein